MALDNIYVLKDVQTYNNEEILNTYTFEGEEGGSAVDLVNAFIEDMLPEIRPAQASQLTHTLIAAYSLGNLADLGEEVVSLAGLKTGQSILPIFNAYSFTLRPTSRAVRPGSKRIAGVYEDAVINGIIVDPVPLGELEAIRVALDTPISTDDALFYTPVIVKRVKYEVPGSDPVRFAYRYPETDEELVFATLSGVKSSPRISHQTSRGN